MILLKHSLSLPPVFTKWINSVSWDHWDKTMKRIFQNKKHWNCDMGNGRNKKEILVPGTYAADFVSSPSITLTFKPSPSKIVRRLRRARDLSLPLRACLFCSLPDHKREHFVCPEYHHASFRERRDQDTMAVSFHDPPVNFAVEMRVKAFLQTIKWAKIHIFFRRQ